MNDSCCLRKQGHPPCRSVDTLPMTIGPPISLRRPPQKNCERGSEGADSNERTKCPLCRPRFAHSIHVALNIALMEVAWRSRELHEYQRSNFSGSGERSVPGIAERCPVDDPQGRRSRRGCRPREQHCPVLCPVHGRPPPFTAVRPHPSGPARRTLANGPVRPRGQLGFKHVRSDPPRASMETRRHRRNCLFRRADRRSLSGATKGPVLRTGPFKHPYLALDCREAERPP